MKKSIKYITALALMAAVTVTSLPNTIVEAKTINELQKERDELSKKTADAQKKLKEAQANKANVEAELSAMDVVINSAQKELDEAQKDLDDVNNRLQESEAALKNATEKREQQLAAFSSRLKFFYENSRISYLEILLDSENFSDMVRRLQYIEDIMAYDNKMLDELSAIQEEIRVRTEEIKEEKEKSEYLLNVAQEKMDNVNAVVAEKKAIMASFAQDEAKYNELVEMNEKASNEAQALINKLMAEESTPKVAAYTGGKLNWPVPSRSPSSSSLSSGYVSRNRPIGKGREFHTGYDIPASYGSAVVAAEAGTVIYAGWMNGYGNTVMVSHGGGLVTLYGHNSSLTVSKGDSVSRGQQIAKIGSTGNSTGNHCHFEVRVNGSHTSPEPYLGVPNISR